MRQPARTSAGTVRGRVGEHRVTVPIASWAASSELVPFRSALALVRSHSYSARGPGTCGRLPPGPRARPSSRRRTARPRLGAPRSPCRTALDLTAGGTPDHPLALAVGRNPQLLGVRAARAAGARGLGAGRAHVQHLAGLQHDVLDLAGELAGGVERFGRHCRQRFARPADHRRIGGGRGGDRLRRGGRHGTARRRGVRQERDRADRHGRAPPPRRRARARPCAAADCAAAGPATAHAWWSSSGLARAPRPVYRSPPADRATTGGEGARVHLGHVGAQRAQGPVELVVETVSHAGPPW